MPTWSNDKWRKFEVNRFMRYTHSILSACIVWGVVFCASGQAASGAGRDLQDTEGALRLTLAESIGMALDSDEQIVAAEAERKAATYALSAARRAKGPTVSWSSQAYRIGGRNYSSARSNHAMYGDPHTEFLQTGVVTDPDSESAIAPVYSVQTVGDYARNNTFANSWNLTVPIYTGGQMEGQITERRYRLNQADLKLENTRQAVRYHAAEAYANLVHRGNLTKVAKDAVDRAMNQLALISTQYEEGAAAKADVLTMEVRLADYRQNLASAQGAEEAARYSLASAVGLPQGTDIRATDVFSYEPYPKDLPACEDYALAHRADGLAADYAIKAAEAQKDAAKSGYRPKVTGVAGQSIASNKPFRSERSNAWEAGVNISWNIFDNGVTAANVDQAKAAMERYRAEAQNMRKNIALETRNAYVEMKVAEANIKVAADAVTKAETSQMIAQVRYEEGVDILLNVTDAQEALTRAKSNYYTALYQYNLSRAALEKAMGVPVGLDVVSYVEAEQNGASSSGAIRAARLSKEEEERIPYEVTPEEPASSEKTVQEMARGKGNGK